MFNKYKTNEVNIDDLAKVENLIILTRGLLNQLEDHVNEHVDYNACEDENEFWKEHGKSRPYNSDVVELASQIRKNMLKIKKVFE